MRNLLPMYNISARKERRRRWWKQKTKTPVNKASSAKYLLSSTVITQQNLISRTFAFDKKMLWLRYITFKYSLFLDMHILIIILFTNYYRNIDYSQL